MAVRPALLRLFAVSLSATVLLSGCGSSQKPEPVQPLPPPVVQRPQPPAPPVTQQPLPPPDAAQPEPGAQRPVRPAQPRLPPVPEGGARAAILLPLTGSFSAIGKGMLNASHLAVFDVASEGFQLVPYDTGDKPDGARAAAEKAIRERAGLVLGPMLGASTRAVAPVAKGANLRVLSFSSDRKVAGDGVYILGFMPEAEVERVITYAAAHGSTRFVLLAPRDTYGQTVAEALRKVAETHHLTIVRSELYDPITADFRPIGERLKALPPGPARTPPSPAAAAPSPAAASPAPAPASPPTPPGPGADPSAGTAAPVTAPAPLPPPAFDAVLIADGGERLRRVAAAVAGAGFGAERVRLLGTGAWDDPELTKEPALIGAWFAAPDPAFRRDFERRYRSAFGSPPPRLATLGYDAAALAAVLAREPSDERFSDARLTNPEGFLGSDGLFRLQADGLPERRIAILQVDRGGVTVIDQPPRRFLGAS